MSLVARCYFDGEEHHTKMKVKASSAAVNMRSCKTCGIQDTANVADGLVSSTSGEISLDKVAKVP